LARSCRAKSTRQLSQQPVLATVTGGANNCVMKRTLRRILVSAPACALLVATAIAAAPALASCDDDEIAFIALDGSLIRMRSGAAFHVLSSDQLDASLWLAHDDVLICNDETQIINKDEEGERVTVKRLHR
jgi:hypothetical protein